MLGGIVVASLYRPSLRWTARRMRVLLTSSQSAGLLDAVVHEASRIVTTKCGQCLSVPERPARYLRPGRCYTFLVAGWHIPGIGLHRAVLDMIPLGE